MHVFIFEPTQTLLRALFSSSWNWLDLQLEKMLRWIGRHAHRQMEAGAQKRTRTTCNSVVAVAL